MTLKSLNKSLEEKVNESADQLAAIESEKHSFEKLVEKLEKERKDVEDKLQQQENSINQLVKSQEEVIFIIHSNLFSTFAVSDSV